MIIVVSDTSPIRALSFLGALPLLHTLYEQVLIPPAVALELSLPRRRFTPTRLLEFPYIVTKSPADGKRVQDFCKTLDRAESEAIALAL